MEEKDSFWNSDSTGFRFEDNKAKYEFDNISKFSARSKNVTAVKERPTREPVNLPHSSIIESSIELPQLKCTTCNKIISESDAIMFEGDKVFTNETCWKHWIDRMVEKQDFILTDIPSYSAKNYLLEKICMSCNGRLIIMIVLLLKKHMDDFLFETLMHENSMAYDHYMSYLRELGETDKILMRSKNADDDIMKRLNDIFLEHSSIDYKSVDTCINDLREFRDRELKFSDKLQIQSEMVDEFVALLELQKQYDKDNINMPLITTLDGSLAYDLFTSNNTHKLTTKFKIIPDEFFWTNIITMVSKGRISDIDKLLNNKSFGAKPSIEMDRVVSFLASLDSLGLIDEKLHFDAKMKCMMKISNPGVLVNTARSSKLLPQFVDFCKATGEKSQLKRIQQFL